MKLLLAEDEQELVDALVTILKHHHYSVDAVDNGEDALYYLETQDYDGAILDIMMPKMDGITVLKTVRQQGNRVPILMLTAKSEIDDRVVGLDSGADDYLAKPFAMKELLARIRAMTRRQNDLVDNIITVGNISLNRSTFELSSDKGAFRLANKEFQMMEILMVNKNHVISTERFMEKIWGYDSDTEMSVVWVYISYLRKKLSHLAADIEIKVVRNQGYRLEVSYD